MFKRVKRERQNDATHTSNQKGKRENIQICARKSWRGEEGKGERRHERKKTR